MSNNSGSQKPYYTSSRRDDSRQLPPLRNHLSEFFQQPGLPSTYAAPQDPSNFEHSVHRQSPLSNTSYSPSPPRNDRSGSRHHGTSQPPSHPRSNDPAVLQGTNHAYAVHDFSRGELVHCETSTNAHFPRRPVRANPEDPSRRHACEECGERFDRPSGLDAHLRTHTGVKPFVCGHAGCGKTFSVKSNMLRHERRHGADSAFETVEEERRTSHAGSSGYYASSSTAPHASSSHASTSGSYYSSSRRK